MSRPVIVDRCGERWLPAWGEFGDGRAPLELYLPGGSKPVEGEITKPDWEWPGYPDRSFEGNRR